MAEVTEKKIETSGQESSEPLRNPDKWWGYIPSTFLEETENLSNTPFSDDVIEYKIVVTDELIDEEGTKERKTSSDTRTVVVGDEAQTTQNPNVDGRLYSLKVVENYPLVEPPAEPNVDWKLPAPNADFPSESVGEIDEISDDFKVSYYVVGNNKVNKLPFDGTRIRYFRESPVLLKVEFGSSLSSEDIALSNEGNVIINEPEYEMYLHIKCFQKEGNFYVEKLKYTGKTGLSSAVIMTPFSYKFFRPEEKNPDVFFLEYLYPNMTIYDKVEFYFEAELTNPNGTKNSFYSKEYSLWASDSEFGSSEDRTAMLAALNEWRGERKLSKPVRNLLLGSEAEEEKIKEASVFDLATKLTDTITSAVSEKILKAEKVISKPIKAATSLKKKFGGF